MLKFLLLLAICIILQNNLVSLTPLKQSRDTQMATLTVRPRAKRHYGMPWPNYSCRPEPPKVNHRQPKPIPHPMEYYYFWLQQQQVGGQIQEDAGPDYTDNQCQTTTSNNNVCIFGSDSGNGGHGCTECCRRRGASSGHCSWFTCWCERK